MCILAYYSSNIVSTQKRFLILRGIIAKQKNHKINLETIFKYYSRDPLNFDRAILKTDM